MQLPNYIPVPNIKKGCLWTTIIGLSLAAGAAITFFSMSRGEEDLESIIEPSESRAIDFETNNRWRCAKGIINLYEDWRVEDYGPAQEFFIVDYLMNPNSDGKVTQEEFDGFLKQHAGKLWTKAFPADVDGTGVRLKTPKCIYETKEDQEKFYELVAKQAEIQKVGNTDAWKQYMKAFVSRKFGAKMQDEGDHVAITFTPKIINDYEAYIEDLPLQLEAYEAGRK